MEKNLMNSVAIFTAVILGYQQKFAEILLLVLICITYTMAYELKKIFKETLKAINKHEKENLHSREDLR